MQEYSNRPQAERKSLPGSTIARNVNSAASETLQSLLEGNQRFRTGGSLHYTYPVETIKRIGDGQSPIAAIVACSDGRVSPEIVFDQPLANLFVSRVPGNVASDSAKWMLEIAVTDLRVPLVMVMGHTECLAIRQVLYGEPGAGGILRSDVARAVLEAKFHAGNDVFQEAVERNALQTAQTLRRESLAVARAMSEGRLDVVAAVYDVHTGEVKLLDR